MKTWLKGCFGRFRNQYLIEKDQKRLYEYQQYYFTKKELILVAIYSVIKTSVIAVLFYNSIMGIMLLMPLCILFINEYRARQIEEKQNRLAFQFKDCIYALSAALSAGYSLENAFSEAMSDMKNMYQESMIVEELSYMINRLKMNVTAEQVLHDLGKRSEIEDIIQLADVVQIVKKTGGNMVDMMKRTAQIIGMKMEVKSEIDTIISAKKYEQKIMSVMPCGMIIYLRITSPGFLNILYETVAGWVVMTLCLLMYYLAVYMGRKIMEIEV